MTVTRARARAPQAADAPLRLTRRGRIVLSILAVIVIVGVLAAVALSLAGGVQAADRGRPGSPYQGLHQVVVQPGQTLWSVAATAEPHADPRVVIQQIISANALSGTTVQAGQLLWVPKG